MSARLLLRGRLAGTLRVPGSKSVTNRALLAAACAPGESVLLNPLECSDTRSLAAALRLLGVEVFFEGASWRVRGPVGRSGPGSGTTRVDVGDAGTPARFLAALLSVVPGRFLLDGSLRMRERPMGPLFDALRALGADIHCVGQEGFLPAAIRGGSLRGGRVTIRGDVSSQFLSALHLVSPLVPGGVTPEAAGPVSSAAYLALTRAVVDGFGATPGGGYRATRFRVPGDDSAACFPLAGALVSEGRVTVQGLARTSGQPDAAFREWAAAVGAVLTWETDAEGEESLTIEGPSGGASAVAGLVADVDAAPDAALPLAATLAFASGASRLTGVARLKDKESDRLEAAVSLLRRSGAVASVETGVGGAPVLEIDGPHGVPRAGAFAAHGDHRVAMTAAVLALALPDGSTLDEARWVGKSWPGFWEAWDPLVCP